MHKENQPLSKKLNNYENRIERGVSTFKLYYNALHLWPTYDCESAPERPLNSLGRTAIKIFTRQQAVLGDAT